jgi:hypothetical protein
VGPLRLALLYQLYKVAAKHLFGRLGAGVRKAIPACVMSEIKDSYPAAKGTEYVGFKESSNTDNHSTNYS